MIKEPDGRWWDVASTYLTSQVILKDWQKLKKTFLEKYYPNSLHAHKEHEFQQFKKNNIYVLEYVEKFKDMAVYSRQTAYAPDEIWKIDRFLFGLRANIAHNVSQREFTTYVESLRKCYMVGNNLKRICEEIEKNRSGYKNQGRSSQYQKP